MSWIDAAKTRSCHDIADALQLQRKGDRIGPCPSCLEEREKETRRLIVGISRGGSVWICNACRVSGDVVDLVAWSLIGKPAKEGALEELETVRGWFAVGSSLTPSRPVSRVPEAPVYPPLATLQADWSRCLEEPLEGGLAWNWLLSRGLAPEDILALELLRERPLSLTPGLSGWPPAPWIAMLPL